MKVLFSWSTGELKYVLFQFLYKESIVSWSWVGIRVNKCFSWNIQFRIKIKWSCLDSHGFNLLPPNLEIYQSRSPRAYTYLYNCKIKKVKAPRRTSLFTPLKTKRLSNDLFYHTVITRKTRNELTILNAQKKTDNILETEGLGLLSDYRFINHTCNIRL